ncbi:AfsR/SARP family transcriptional regulator [Phytohabitans sp. LJ34]|uniref:AfsR/SARP family transcriptional regulator n=1 Tax=Phytohabitans sp. LJ34 TaxID=3452217 RepID=UPI003F8C619D
MTLIDRWELRSGADPVATTPAVQRLAAFLALQGPHDRAWIAGQLWPECNERHAHGALRSALWRIRHQHPGLVRTARGAIALDPAVRLDVDRILSRAAAILEEGQTPADALTVLSAGDLLPGWYEDWVMLHRERLHQLQLHALEHLAALLTRDGDYHRALQAGLTAVRLNPLRESAHRVVAQVHLAEGNICEAIRQYEQCRHILANELGIVPTRHFRGLLAPHLAAHTTPPSPVAASGSHLS